MIANKVSPRGSPQRASALAQSPICVALITLWNLSFTANAQDAELAKLNQSSIAAAHATDGTARDKDDDNASKDTTKKHKSAVLTITVTGNGKPIEQADVRVTFPSSVGGERTLPTDDKGQAVFDSTGIGAAKVRVLVNGWESLLQDVTLKEGPQRLTIKLNPFP